MQANVVWQQDVCFKGVSGTGHEVIMDGPEEKGGKDQGARPMEMILLGLGGCASFDVVMILQKSRQKVTGCEVKLEAKRAEDQVPAVFTEIKLLFQISGEDLNEKHVKRAVSLSAEKYCSISTMLKAGGVDILFDYEIVN